MHYNTVTCEYCGKEIRVSSYTLHKRKHEKNPDSFNIYKGKYKLNHDGLTCQYCGKECKNRNSLCNHERLCKENPDRQLTSYEKYGPIVGFNNKGRTAWNRGLDITDERIKNSVETFKKNKDLGLHSSSSHPQTEYTRKLISDKMLEVYSKKVPSDLRCGRSKKGWYKGYYCQSSWELAFVLYCLDNNISIKRNNKGFKYLFEGAEHTYYPDFYMIDENTYIEIKGYYDNKSKEKYLQFPENIIMLKKNEMIPILSYVEEKYGKNYVDLFEK